MIIHNVTQGSEEWLRMRLGKITGTRLKSVVGSLSVQDTLIYELIAEQLTGQAEEVYVNNAMRWGTEHEEEAISVYEKMTGQKTEAIGFCTSDEFPYLGLSPDRLIKKRGKYVKGVEVKAPSTKSVIKYRLDGVVPSEYHWQVVNYFLVNESLKDLDFLIYDPRIIRPELRLTIIPVHRKDVADDIARARSAVIDFHERWRGKHHAITGVDKSPLQKSK